MVSCHEFSDLLLEYVYGLLEGAEAGLGRVLVRVRNNPRFFHDLNRLVLEEWFDVVHLETLDDSTQAVLGYLLGRKG